MFTEFDELMAVERVQGLLRERGRRRTTEQIRTRARFLAASHDLDLDEAYEQMEATLLDDNPRPERFS